MEIGRPMGMVAASFSDMGHRIEGGKGGALRGTVNMKQPAGSTAAFQHTANRLGIDGFPAKEHLLDTLKYPARRQRPAR